MTHSNTRRPARYRIVEFSRKTGPWLAYGFKGMAIREDGSNDEECRCAVVEEGVETPERIASGMCLHISCAETYFEETESCPGKR